MRFAKNVAHIWTMEKGVTAKNKKIRKIRKKAAPNRCGNVLSKLQRRGALWNLDKEIIFMTMVCFKRK